MSSALKEHVEQFLGRDDVDLASLRRLSDTFYGVTELTKAPRRIDAGQRGFLTPVSAAACLDDGQRSLQFMRGLREAVQSLLDKGIAPVHVCEVGSGPFAPLVTCVSTCFSPFEMKFSAVDADFENQGHVEACVRGFGREAQFLGFKLADATYSNNFAPGVHIFVVECMDAALFTEPQAAIQMNLRRSFPQAIVLPERIDVEVHASEQVNPVVSWDAAEMDRRIALPFSRRNQLKVSATFPGSRGLSGFLTTRVRVFGDHLIEPSTSVITRPVPLNAPFSGVTRFSYKLGRRPFEVDWV
jgi:hypothetical protein